MDTSNITIALVGYVIVFAALVILYFVFASIPKLIKLRHNIIQKRKDCKGEECVDEFPEFITGQENAAIATAIYLYLNELHDEETAVMTIKRIRKVYSPWSSKLHGMNNILR
jgi:hypothetical protein